MEPTGTGKDKLSKAIREDLKSRRGKGNISDKGLQELEEICEKMRAFDEAHKIPPTQLYCLNCGTKIGRGNYTGGMMSLTHPCPDPDPKIVKIFEILDTLMHSKEAEKTEYWSGLYAARSAIRQEHENLCTWLATTEGPLMSASFVSLNQAHKPGHCDCKDVEEHIERTLHYYLGKHYKDYTPEDPKIADMKKEVIKYIRMKIEKDQEEYLEEVESDKLEKQQLKQGELDSPTTFGQEG